MGINILFALGALLLLLIVYLLIIWQLRRARLAYLREYQFHHSIVGRFSENFMFLSDEELERIFEGLRDYFTICLKANKKAVTMPSKAVDEAWHIFSLYTREYERFCQKALGRFLTYTPVERVRASGAAKEGIKTAWRWACILEDIEPKDPDRLPRLFSIDVDLEIPKGFDYSLTGGTRRARSSGGDFSSSELLNSSGKRSTLKDSEISHDRD